MGSFECSCKKGYKLLINERNCQGEWTWAKEKVLDRFGWRVSDTVETFCKLANVRLSDGPAPHWVHGLAE